MRIILAFAKWTLTRLACAWAGHGPKLDICGDVMYCGDCGKEVGRC